MGIQGGIVAMACGQLVVSGGGNHGGVIGGEARGREKDVKPVLDRGLCKPFSEQGIAGNTSGYEDGMDSDGVCSGNAAPNQIADHSLLKARNEVECVL